MKYNCPHCGTAKEIDQSVIPTQGIDLQCFNCFNEFHVPFGASEKSSSSNGKKESTSPKLESNINSPGLFDRSEGFGFDLNDSSRDQVKVIPKSSSNASSPLGITRNKPKTVEDLPGLVSEKKAALKTFESLKK